MGMGKGLGGELGEGGKGVEPNNPIYGEGFWNGGGGVRETGRREDGLSDCEEGRPMPKHDGRDRWYMYEIGRSIGGRVGEWG